jgi:CPA1 family monovalent cation:H+ antiporter
MLADALAAARAEVLAARREPGVDPEAADRVLRRLDLRTVLLD